MKILRWLGIGVAALAVAIALLLVGARFADGPPVAMVAGGPLRSGELVTDPITDWGFVADIPEIELQLVSPPRSRTTWIVEHEGRAYIPCGFMNSGLGKLWKQWPVEAQEDGRAVVRIDGKRYERQLVRVEDPELFAVVAAKIADKYGFSSDELSATDGGLWIFEVAKRS